MATQRLFQFSFRELYGDDVPICIERQPGSHNGKTLTLGGETSAGLKIDDQRINDVRLQEENQLVVGWQDDEHGPMFIRMTIDKNIRDVKRILDFGLSRRRFSYQLEQLASKKIGHLCRETICPHCQAQILTIEQGLPSPQVYCEYCDSLITTIEIEGLASQNLNQYECQYRLCKQCGMYSRPRKFSIVYFYFLIFHAGFHHQVTYRCTGCMRPTAWLMLFGNLFGLLGIPVAIVQLVRAYRDSIRKGPFRGLDTANRLLQRGRVERALMGYSKIIEIHPVSAGVLYNIALGLIAQNDLPHARQTLEMGLENCPNYVPSLRKLDEISDSSDGRLKS